MLRRKRHTIISILIYSAQKRIYADNLIRNREVSEAFDFDIAFKFLIIYTERVQFTVRYLYL